MFWLIAFATGYVLGARTDKQEFDDVVEAWRAVRDSEEVRDLVSTVRSHAGHALRGLADVVERHTEDESSVRATGAAVLGADFVDRVRRMVSAPQ